MMEGSKTASQYHDLYSILLDNMHSAHLLTRNYTVGSWKYCASKWSRTPSSFRTAMTTLT